MKQEQFIQAYCAAYGCTVQHAKEVYAMYISQGKTEAIDTIIDGWLRQAKMAFYCD